MRNILFSILYSHPKPLYNLLRFPSLMPVLTPKPWSISPPPSC